MKRVANWGVKLRDFAREHIGQPFVWGETDCVNFARKALAVMYDEDVLSGTIDSTWTSRVGALRVYNRIGPFGDRLIEAGFYEIPKTVVRDGDLLVSTGEVFENVVMIIGGRGINCNDETGRIEVSNVDVYSDDITAYRLNG